MRGVFMLPVRFHVPIVTSYTSADARTPELLEPPAIRTFPWPSDEAVWPRRATCILAVRLHLPVVGSYSSADAVEWVQKHGEEGDKKPWLVAKLACCHLEREAE